MVRLHVWIFRLLSLVVGRFSIDLLHIVFVCIVIEKPNRVWKRPNIDDDNVVISLSLVSFCTVLAFLLVHRISVFSDVTSFYFFVVAIYRKEQRVRQGAKNGYYHKCGNVHLMLCG